MKIECLKTKLQKAVSLAERATASNLSLPVLRNIIIEAVGSNLIIRSTNLEIGLELSVPAKVEAEGIAACSPGVLGNFLSNIKDEDKITLELKEGNILIKTASHTTLIKSEDHQDFPNIPRIDSPKKLVLKNTELVSGIKSVLYAAAVSDIKPEISSVYVFTENDRIYFVATDSFRLAEKSILPSRSAESLPPLIIPFKNASEIVRVFEAETADVELHSDGNQLSVISAGLHLTSRLIDGVYPDYRQIMPKNSTTTAVVLKDDLQAALKVSNIFSGKYHQIKLDVNIKDKQVVIHSESAEVGENTATIPATIEGTDFSAGYNARYILEAFQSITFGEISLGVTEPSRPLLLKGKGDSTFSYIVMPVNR